MSVGVISRSTLKWSGWERLLRRRFASPRLLSRRRAIPLRGFTIASIIVQWWGGKPLCVVVKILIDDAFVVTAYLTDRVKKGTLLWPKKS